ncbi:MAG: ABC transporter ATP-binding protein [Chloroflexi bacterium]|nr:ABC transporter ATP-binding protein [Chloroflexota bacterium]
MNALLEVRDLRIEYPVGSRRQEGWVCAVGGVSFSVAEGDSVGLIGESGCGKTSAIRAILRLHAPATRVSGQVLFRGRDVLTLPEAELRRVRWQEIALVPQSAMNSLNPVHSVGAQIVEGLLAHQSMPWGRAWKQAGELLEMVGVPGERLRAYPHQLSGGMKQRVCLAMALSLRPSLLLADEPTTALDVILQDRILAELERLRSQFGVALVLVTHDISVVAETCRKVVVLYGGQVVEAGPVDEVFTAPAHPYTMGLLNSSITLRGARRAISIPGTVPEPGQGQQGCIFVDRCPFATDRCRSERPSLAPIDQQRRAACHYRGEAAAFRQRATHEELWQQQQQLPPGASLPAIEAADRDAETRGRGDAGTSDGVVEETGAPLVQVGAVRKWFPVYQLFPPSWLQHRPARYVKAVDGVGFSVERGEVLGLAGESGSGKSTTAELLVRLQDCTAGSITYRGTDVRGLKGVALREFRRRVQMVVQDPYQSLNPHFSVQALVEEPLAVHSLGQGRERQERVRQALHDVGLRPAERYLDRRPHELSGGERQRVSLARALVLQPEFLVLDEPTSMLDLSLRAGLLNLLQRLQEQYRLTMILISHDLAVLRYMCRRIAIMYLGQIMEIGETQVLMDNPLHPYTRSLMAAIPNPDPRQRRPRTDLPTDLDERAPRPPGCPFEPRCKLRMPACRERKPALFEHQGREVACWLYSLVLSAES